jgi:hypothetical protein
VINKECGIVLERGVPEEVLYQLGEAVMAMTQEQVKEALRLADIIAALEGAAGNTDTDPMWAAAKELRRVENWENRTVRSRALAAQEAQPVAEVGDLVLFKAISTALGVL